MLYNRSKAAADGAVIWLARLSVTSRATRFAYGARVGVPFDTKNESHRGRPTFTSADGLCYVSGVWSEIVPRVSTNSIIRRWLNGLKSRTES